MRWTYKLPIMPLVDEAVTSMDDVLVADPITTKEAPALTTSEASLGVLIPPPTIILILTSFDTLLITAGVYGLGFFIQGN